MISRFNRLALFPLKKGLNRVYVLYFLYLLISDNKYIKKIPNTHELYTIFFEFENGPPTTSQELNGWGDDLVHEYLKAIEVNGRIGVLYSNKDYGCEWDYDFRNKRWYKIDNTRFGVNIVMYALTS